MYSKLTQAHKRPMTTQERFGLVVFILKFFLSKFGIFLIFLSLHILGNFHAKINQFSVTHHQVLSPQTFMIDSEPKLKNEEQALTGGPRGKEGQALLVGDLAPADSKGERMNGRYRDDLAKENKSSDFQRVDTLIPYFSFVLFSKLKIYCIIGTIVTLFLNPQQTKYFGGLAVALKQAGFFSKYGKSEKTVYVFSWIFIMIFIQMSYTGTSAANLAISTKMLRA